MSSEMPKPKPLRCWNSRYWNGQAFVIYAHSKADAIRLLHQAASSPITTYQLTKDIRDFFTELAFKHHNFLLITPERGVWVIPFPGAEPSRVI